VFNVVSIGVGPLDQAGSPRDRTNNCHCQSSESQPIANAEVRITKAESAMADMPRIQHLHDFHCPSRAEFTDGRQGNHMATAVLPIRELSADVQVQAADAQRGVLCVVESKRRERDALFVSVLVSMFVIFLKVRELDRSFGKLAETQQKLIGMLEAFSSKQLEAPDFAKVGDDLSRIVADTSAVINDAYEMPDSIVRKWATRLELVQEHNSHIESISESFRIAADETCVALLADMAQTIMSSESIRA